DHLLARGGVEVFVHDALRPHAFWRATVIDIRRGGSGREPAASRRAMVDAKVDRNMASIAGARRARSRSRVSPRGVHSSIGTRRAARFPRKQQRRYFSRRADNLGPPHGTHRARRPRTVAAKEP